PTIELTEDGSDGRLWVVTNRCELMCVDISGFADGNDGLTDEVDQEMQDADIIWNLDMINELGVFPHNLATSSPLVYEDMVYVLTSNGVDEAHLELPSPRAPSFLAVNKESGEVVWESNAPFDQVLHGQWGSPTMGLVNGQAQIYFPGGDGWLYALDAKTGEEIWKFDMNPKDSLWELGGAGSRNAVIATGVFKDNSLLIAVGQDPEHGEGVGHLWRIDCTKTGDISPEIGEIGEVGEANPDSGVIWHYGGSDDTGEVTGREGRSIFRRTMSTVAIADGMVFAADLSGFVHCIDYESGERHWEHDLFSGVWGSPMVADGKMFIGTEDGSLVVLEANPADVNVMKVIDTINNSSIYSTPTIANGNMYITDRTRLYSVKIQDTDE
ncbi:MAG: PQQ-binding-like beta-propeller repeat protein, partial [Pirellulaceae bacterium]